MLELRLRAKTLIAVSALASLTSFVPACAGARGGSVQAPVDVTIAPVGISPATSITSTGELSGDSCSLRLVVSRIEKSASGCYLDEHVSEGPGVLRYACNGDGDAEADFGQDHYTGKIHAGNVHLELSTELDWEDGCRWGTQASITGIVVLGQKPVLKKLAWSYLDRIITGADCSGTCTAKASIEVTSSKSAARGGKDQPSEEESGD
jgi:hypothetical protein